MRRLGHVPALDGLRGIAILLVLMAHTLDGRWLFFSGGALGVDLFFVLSGFLITTLLLEEWDRRGEISLRGFYGRRARRLLPALVAVVLVGAVAEAIGGISPGLLFARLAVRLSYVANFVGVFDPRLLSMHVFGQLWTLGLEEQFYLLWPLALILLLRRGASDRRIARILVVVVFAIMWNRLLWSPFGDWQRMNYLPDTHGDVILVGCLAAFVWRRGWFRPSSLETVAAVAVAAVMVAWFRETSNLYLSALPLFAVAVAVLLLAGLEPGRWSRVLEVRGLQATGRVSYSLYLWHVPLIAVLGPIPGVLVAVPVAVASYRFIEQPFRRRRARRAPEPALAGV